jgi:hypothetical protein
MTFRMTGPTSPRTEPRVRLGRCRDSAKPCSNPLTSFVLHMMYQNCGNIRRPRRVGLHKAPDVRISVREMDEVVEVIEDWEADGKFQSG